MRHYGCFGTSRSAEAGGAAVRRVPVLALGATDDQLVRRGAQDTPQHLAGYRPPRHCGHMLPIGRAAENGADRSSITRIAGSLSGEVDPDRTGKNKPTISIVMETVYISTRLAGDSGTCGERSRPYH
jgi:hypothetical protein